MMESYEDSGHGLKGPHRRRGSGPASEFVPLRLEVQTHETAPESLSIEVSQPVAVVGRHTGADVRLAYPDVSRRHCRLSFEEGCWHIVDLNSLNGMFINGERIHEAVLQHGDLIRVGSVTLAVHDPAMEKDDYPGNAVLRSIVESLEPPPSWPPLAA